MAVRNSKSGSKSKARSAPASTRSAPGATDSLRGQSEQLATIRARYPALKDATASALLAQHDDAACRARGGNTKAADTFRGALAWARMYGEHAGDAAAPEELVRWFLDCLTSLGTLLSGRSVAANPAAQAALEDAVQGANRALRRVVRRARSAAGSNTAWSSAIDTALAAGDANDDLSLRLRALATQLEHWLDPNASSAPPLRTYGLSAASVTQLRDTAGALDTALANKPAQRQLDQDSPAVNTAEGRLYFVMRALWDDAAESREDGKSTLQLPVTPALLRGLDIAIRKHGKAAAKPAKAPT